MSAAFEHFSPIKSKNILNQVKNVFENKKYFFWLWKNFQKVQRVEKSA